jgi:hypothetical protein
MAGRERSRPVFFARGNGVGGSADDPICGAAEAIRPGARQAGMPAPRSSRAWTIIQRRERLAPGVGQAFLLVRGAARPRSGADILACPRSSSPPEWGRHSCLSAERLAPGVGQTFLLVRGAARPRSGADILACPRSSSPPSGADILACPRSSSPPEWGRHSCLSAEQLAPGVGQTFLSARWRTRRRRRDEHRWPFKRRFSSQTAGRNACPTAFARAGVDYNPARRGAPGNCEAGDSL